ncbi:MAG: hypothetical protein AABO57_22565 [Acidobacteriota bacterium]
MEIINQCHNPPRGALWHLRRSLGWINASDLEGLYCVRLLDALPEPNEESDEFYKYAWKEGHHIYGIYSPENRNTVSCITLNLGDIYRLVPFIYWWTTVPTLLIAHSLAHEVAHHLVATRGYVFKNGENLEHREYEEVAANRYAFYVVKKMEERWYYRLARWMIKDLADHHHVLALLDWREKKYEKSAEHWYRAWCLNPELDEAAYWYLRARKMCSGAEEQQTE